MMNCSSNFDLGSLVNVASYPLWEVFPDDWERAILSSRSR